MNIWRLDPEVDAVLDQVIVTTEAIHKEKQKEFAGEGVLYFDLKRLHSGGLSRLSQWGDREDTKIKVDDYRWCFPIPRSEYKYNENITQNEGWPLNR